ncbi:FliM/FliN family flagellar motor C-terminal domain-containing protein [Puniceibacterium confluentis]|nr:FliM/FliN family flagellar motor C-terminal domain-containing protein [Puniceibacterium confluentis]
MGEPARQDVLGQKASASRRALESRAMSPAKALRRALSRTSDTLWDLPLVTQGVQQEVLDQDGSLELLAPGALVLLLEGPDGVRGLASVDREVMTALIEVQTISRVTRMPIEDRALTPTDAAMMAPLIDGTFERFEANLAGHPDLGQLGGYRYGALVEDARTAGLLLEAASFRTFRITVDLATGTRRGEILFILPVRAAEVAEAAPDSAQPGRHEQRMMLVPARIEAVLARIRMPLSRASALRPGDLLELPVSALNSAELIVGRGHGLAFGRLGQMNGFRAIRLQPPKTLSQDPGTTVTAAAETPTPPAPQQAALARNVVAGPMAQSTPPDDIGDLPDLPPLDFD